jgi:hypothetical protein
MRYHRRRCAAEPISALVRIIRYAKNKNVCTDSCPGGLEGNAVNVYRGCMFYLFGFLIAIFSAALGRTYGVAGMLLPWLMVGTAYGVVYLALNGLERWAEDWDAQEE